jgi:hypothetical protein
VQPEPDTDRGAALLRLALAADGRAHPSTAVRRRNDAVPGAIDPFVRVSLPVAVAFLCGARQARRRLR